MKGSACRNLFRSISTTGKRTRAVHFRQTARPLATWPHAAGKASIRAQGQRVTSALTIAETARAVLRARLSGRLTAQQHRAALLTLQRFARRCHIVSVTETILTRAGRPFPTEPIRTLGAIHLATAEALGDPPALVVIVTRDLRVRENATALGYPVE